MFSSTYRYCVVNMQGNVNTVIHFLLVIQLGELQSHSNLSNAKTVIYCVEKTSIQNHISLRKGTKSLLKKNAVILHQILDSKIVQSYYIVYHFQ